VLESCISVRYYYRRTLAETQGGWRLPHFHARDASLSTGSSLLATRAVHFCLSCVFVDVHQLKLMVIR